MLRFAVTIILSIVTYFNCSGQNPAPYSKWTLQAGIAPHITDFVSSLKTYRYLTTWTYVAGVPELEGKLEYRPLRQLSFSGGLSYLYSAQELWYGDPYTYYPRIHIYNVKSHIIEIPALVSCYVLNRKHISIAPSIGYVNSFSIYSDITPSKRLDGSKVTTTIYQGYLQAGINFSFSRVWKGAIYINPFVRFLPVVDYYDRDNYDIGYYPNVFYQRMLGISMGYKWAIWQDKQP